MAGTAPRGIDALSVLDEAIAEFVSRGYVHGLGRTDLVVAHRKRISEAFGR
jgi:hypothetical protein